MGAIIIAYSSETGHTLRVAKEIAAGIEHNGTEPVSLCDVHNPETIDWAAFSGASAIIFGTPTFMGGVSAAFKAFMDSTSNFWNDQPWQNKIAAGFTIGSRNSGDKLQTLQHLALFAAQHGMIWVGQGIVGDRAQLQDKRLLNGDGSWLGLMTVSSPDKSEMIPRADAETANQFGSRIARVTMRWETGKGKAVGVAC